MNEPSGQDAGVSMTSSDAEDAGAAHLWSIADEYLWLNSGTWTEVSTDRSLRLAVKGSAAAGGTTDSTDPRVASIERLTPEAEVTNADSLTWRVTFSEDVENVDATDFTVFHIDGSNVTHFDESVSSVDASTYDVTSSDSALADFEGMVTLFFAGIDVEDITDTSGNTLNNTDPTGDNENSYTLDNTAPALQSASVDSSGVFIDLIFDENLASPIQSDQADYITAISEALSLSVNGRSVNFNLDGDPGGSNKNALRLITVGADVIKQNQTVVVAYTDPTEDMDDALAIEDVAGNDAASFTTGQDMVPAVANNSTLPASSDATLSALALTNPADSADVDLIPDFAADTTAYRARVANTVTQVTVSPTVNHSGAYYRIQDASGTDIADNDTVGAGHQVALAEGASTIRVLVTAEDGSTQTYTVVVGRPTAATACMAPDLSMRREVWSGVMTVGAFRVGGIDGHGFLDAILVSGGNLDSRDFSIGATDHTIFEIRHLVSGTYAGDMIFRSDKFLPGVLQLHVCDNTPYEISAASLVSGRYVWTDNLDWSTTTALNLWLSLPLNSDPTGMPDFTGITQRGRDADRREGHTLDDADGEPDNFPTGYTFQWEWKAVDSGLPWAPIEGATMQTYVVTADEVGDEIRVVVNFTDSLGTDESVASDLQTINTPPRVDNPIPDQTVNVGESFSYVMPDAPDAIFGDINGLHTLTYEATKGDGTALPAWLAFDPATRTFSGTPQAADAGTLSVKVVATDNVGETAEDTFVIKVNRVPTVANEIPDQKATAGTAFSFQFLDTVFSDPDSDPLTYEATKGDGTALPGWLAFDPATRTFSGTPQVADAGTLAVKVTADDDNGGTVSDTFNIDVNRPPTVANPISDQTATVGESFSYQFPDTTFNDADSDPLSYTAVQSADNSALPGWLTFTGTTRTFSGTPQATDTGTLSIKVTADDDKGGTVNDTFDIVVSDPANTAPTVQNTIPDQTDTEGSSFDFTFDANTFSDADSDPLTYRAATSDDMALPDWLTFDAATRNFASDRLPDASVGTHTLKVTADDGNGGTVSDEFDLTVAANCPAPTFGTRRQVWQSSVTVVQGQHTVNDPYWGYDDSESPAVGALGDTGFELGGTDYTVNAFTTDKLGGGTNWAFVFAPATITGAQVVELRVHVCDRTLDVEDTFKDPPDPADTFAEFEGEEGFDWSGVSTRTVALSVPANNAPGGMVEIDGTLTVGQVLTANTSGITDADGLVGATYEYQWIRVNDDGTSNPVEIPGATAETYTLTSDETTKRIKVQVKFKDNLHVEGQDPESLTSEAYPKSGTVTDPTDATLSDLKLSNAADDSAVALTPPFASGTAAYTATVANSVTQVTVAPKTGDSGASFEILDSADNAIADAATKTGHQVDLDPGANVIKVRVTSADTNTEQDYTVTVTRTSGPNTAPTVINAIPDQTATVGAQFTYRFPDTTFNDADGDPLTYTARKADDNPLPGWLAFDPATREFSGTPQPGDVATLSVKVNADDDVATKK